MAFLVFKGKILMFTLFNTLINRNYSDEPFYSLK